MHPKIEARRQAVAITRQITALERDRDALLHDLRDVRDALLRMSGGYMNLPTVAALAASADRMLETISEIDVHGDEDHVKTCLAFFESSLNFVESAKRTLSAAQGIMPE